LERALLFDIVFALAVGILDAGYNLILHVANDLDF